MIHRTSIQLQTILCAFEFSRSFLVSRMQKYEPRRSFRNISKQRNLSSDQWIERKIDQSNHQMFAQNRLHLNGSYVNYALFTLYCSVETLVLGRSKNLSNFYHDPLTFEQALHHHLRFSSINRLDTTIETTLQITLKKKYFRPKIAASSFMYIFPWQSYPSNIFLWLKLIHHSNDVDKRFW